jgi:thiol:disulfide interchange protein DsbA
MAKVRNKSLTQQKIAIGAGAAIIAAIALYFSTMVVTDIPLGEYELGVHYQELENPRRLRGDKIQVMEIFSYGCIHCYNLESDLEDWIEDNQEKATLVRVPAISNESWRVLARGFYASKILGIREKTHVGVFHAIHDKRANLGTPEKLAAHFDGKGTTAEEFSEVYKSAEVTKQVAEADRIQRRYRVASVPTLVVNGKYRVTTTQQVGRSRILDVVDYLVEKELAAKSQSVKQ